MAAIIGRVSAHEGYVGLTQAEAKIFISEEYLFSPLVLLGELLLMFKR